MWWWMLLSSLLAAVPPRPEVALLNPNLRRWELALVVTAAAVAGAAIAIAVVARAVVGAGFRIHRGCSSRRQRRTQR